jgi:opacity protein-like surface antigen
MKKILTGIVFFAGASLANADSFLYGEFAYVPFNYKETANSATYSATGGTAARGIIGVDLVESLALEAIFASGLSMAKTTGNIANINLDRIYGFYVKPKVNIGENATLFARMGFTLVTGSTSISDSSFSGSSTDNSISYGIGMSYKLSETLSVNADYMNYYNSNSSNATGVALGIGFKF